MSASKHCLVCALAVAALLPAAGYGADEQPGGVLRHTTRQPQFSIPFSLDRPADEVAEVRLFVSSDGGRRWQLASAQPPQAGRFPFRAPADGVYWFTSRTVDKQQQLWPRSMLRPELEVRVDSTQPQLELQAAAAEDKVRVEWSAWDPSLAPASLQLQYRTGTGPWKTADLKPQSRTGQRLAGVVELPGADGPWELRATAADLAGNRSQATRQLGGAESAAPAAAESSAGTRSPPQPPWLAGRKQVPEDPLARMGVRGWSSRQPADSPQPSAASDTKLPLASSLPSDEPWPASGAAGPGPGGFAASGAVPPSADQSVSTAAATAAAATAAGAARPPVPPSAGSTYQAVAGAVGPPVADHVSIPPAATEDAATEDSPWQSAGAKSASEAGGSEAAPPGDGGTGAAADGGPRPGTAPEGVTPQWTSRTRFSIDYQIDAVAPEHVAEVELWATEDGGRSWTQWGADPDRVSPLSIKIDREGVYGFHVVVVSDRGMASPTPTSARDADVWVGVDYTPPQCELTSARIGEGREAGRLDIRWTAADGHLPPRPVSLHYSPSVEGPWKPLATDLDNSGRYLWQPTPDVPQRVYLRLVVKDRAGNPGEHVSPSEIKLAGLRPRGRISGLQPLTAGSADAPASTD